MKHGRMCPDNPLLWRQLWLVDEPEACRTPVTQQEALLVCEYRGVFW
jgi:hypothetical protein